MQKYSRCSICGTLVSWIDTGEPLNPYLASLGFKKSGRASHYKCIMNKYAITPEEVKADFERNKKAICSIHGEEER